MIRAWFGFAFLMSCLVASAQVTGLSFRPVDASYSLSLDRIVFVAANPNAVHIYDPVANLDRVVGLSEVPLNLSLSPDGNYAAVAHADAVSYVDLKAGSVLQKFGNVPVGNGRVVFGAGFIYILPNGADATSINVSTGQYTVGGYNELYNGVFDAAQNAIYAIGRSGISKFDTSGGALGNATPEPSDYFNTFTYCSPLWLSQDSRAIYSACGITYRASTDTTNDMRYSGTLAGLSPFSSTLSLATSNALKQVGLITRAQNNGTVTGTYLDTVVNLYDANLFSLTGQFATTPFVNNGTSFSAHGRWVFYNSSSSSVFIVTQADPSASLAQDYAVENVTLTTPNSCNASFGGNSASAVAPGAYGRVQVLSGEDCVFTAVSSVPWIVPASGYYGSGNTALTYLVRPNLLSNSRSGTITMGSQTFTVNQAAATAFTSFNPLSFKPIAADYSKALDKIVTVGSSPNELHIYDPITHADQIVPLNSAPLSVSVRPDGLFAVTGQSGKISIVDLQAGAVTQVISVDMDNAGVLLAGNGYAYTFPQETIGFEGMNSIQLATGTVTSLQGNYAGNIPRLDASGKFLYVGGSSGGISKFDISTGPATLVHQPTDQVSSDIWLSEDGNRLFTASGGIFFTSAVPMQDLQADGTFGVSADVDWAANSQTQHQTAVLNDPSSTANTELQLYSDNGLQLISQVTMPGFSNNGSSYVSHGRYLFWNSSETALFAILEADGASGLLSDFAVYNINAPESSAPCTYSVSPSFLNMPPFFAFGYFKVTSNCEWKAIAADTNEIFLPNGGNNGNGTFTADVGTNSGVARSTTISVGNQTVTINQAASTCVYSLSSTQQTFSQLGGVGTVNLTTSAGCAWSIESGASWLTWSGQQSSVGFATIQFQVAANSDLAISSRTASLYVAGYSLTINQMQLANPPSGTSLITDQTPGALRNDYTGYVGFNFTVGSVPIRVTALGRFGALFSGSSPYYAAHLVKLVQANGVDVPNGSVSISTNGVNGAYQYTSLTSAVTLLAKTSYYLVSQETAGGEYWYDIGPVTASSVATVVAPTYTDAAGHYYPVAGLAGQSYVPLNFLYAPVTSSTPNLSVTITSPQSGATISSSTVVTVTTTGSVANLQLQVDGMSQGAANVLTLNPASLTNGSHVLTVVASDAQSNSVTSAPVTISVSNSPAASSTTFVTGQSLTVLRNNYSGYVGFSFTTGATAVTVTSLGRYVAAGNKGSHFLKLVNSDGSDVVGASATVSLAGATAGQYSYASLATGVTLQANTTYYLMCQETSGGDQWYDIGYITTTGAARVNAPVYTDAAGHYYPVKGLTGQSYGPLSFGYQTATSGTPVAAMTSFLTGETLGKLRNDYTGYVGMAFQVGANPITVTALGSLSVSTSATANLTVKLVNADGTDLTGGSVALAPGSGTAGQFNYVLLNQPVALTANATYLLVSQETAGAGQWYDLGPVTSTGVAQIIGAVYSYGNGKYFTVNGTQNYSYVPVSFLYQ